MKMKIKNKFEKEAEKHLHLEFVKETLNNYNFCYVVLNFKY